MGRSIEAVITDASDNCVGIVSNGLRINCQKLVMRGQTCPPHLKQVQNQPQIEMERKICLNTESILPSEKEQLTFLSVPPKSNSGKFNNSKLVFVSDCANSSLFMF